ncbi:hypothetical protein NQZ68_035133 [Dissostichus eleginoides]|nr:hypothetical protein NQZ68_035133 [Dissostichus eleginoides]
MGRGPGEAREGVDGSFEMVQTGSSSSLPQQQGPTLKHAQTLQPERAQGSSSLPDCGNVFLTRDLRSNLCHYQSASLS